MADEKKNIPAWQQQAQKEPEPPTETETSKPNDDDSASEAADTTTPEASLEQARQFLKDENVQSHTVEKKAEFLRSKGFSDEQIQALLGGAEQASEAGVETAAKSEPQETSSPAPAPSTSPPSQQEASPTVEPSPSSTTITESRVDVPPIITYPEFLTTSPRPPPLITPSRLLNILTVSGGVFTLLYGSARYLINPMVSDLNDARADYHEHVGEKLGELVEKLEEVVSEVPYKDKDGKVVLSSSRRGATTEDNDHEDNESTCSDPTELFHRDFGTQTSSPPPESSLAPSPTTVAEKEKENPIDKQASRLASIRASLGELNDMYTRRAEDSADLSESLRSIRDDVDGLALPPSGSYAYYSSADSSSRGPNGADEEFRRTKDAIRSVKGMFLSARSFPTASVSAR